MTKRKHPQNRKDRLIREASYRMHQKTRTSEKKRKINTLREEEADKELKE
jgi:hypothetical protein